MTTAQRPTSQISRRYAQAFLDMAIEAKAVDSITSDMNDLRGLMDEKVFADFIASPLYGKDEQFKVIAVLGKKAKLHKLTVNFLKTLSDNKRLSDLSEILIAYTQVLRKHKGELYVDVQTAYELDKTQVSDLSKSLTKALGANVEIHQETDKDLIGGMVVTVGSVMVDDSIRGKLEKLKLKMKSGSNENIEFKKAK